MKLQLTALKEIYSQSENVQIYEKIILFYFR